MCIRDSFYALLTITMLIVLSLANIDYGPMAKFERNALDGDLFSGKNPYAGSSDDVSNAPGTVMDLLIPILSLIVCCVLGMIYSGGFFSGVDFVTAFSGSDASVGLALGSFFGLVITVILYLVRRILTFKQCMDCIPEGFKLSLIHI